MGVFICVIVFVIRCVKRNQRNNGGETYPVGQPMYEATQYPNQNQWPQSGQNVPDYYAT